jgi:hypothetical protein
MGIHIPLNTSDGDHLSLSTHEALLNIIFILIIFFGLHFECCCCIQPWTSREFQVALAWSHGPLRTARLSWSAPNKKR